MQKNIQMLMKGFVCFIVITIGSYVIAAQGVIEGTWKANNYEWNHKHTKKYKNKDKYKDKNKEKFRSDKVYLNFRYENSRGNRSNHGSGFSYNDLQGLTKSQVESSNSNVRFQIVREAGRIDCEGTFRDTKGSGTFRFTPNQNFISAMESRGFRNLSSNKLFSSATLDITTAFVDDVRSMGFQDLDYEDVFKAKIFKITPQYAREMTSIGFPNLDMEDLVKARIFKIDADYAREVVNMGFRNNSLERLVKLRIFKVTPEFIKKLNVRVYQI